MSERIMNKRLRLESRERQAGRVYFSYAACGGGCGTGEPRAGPGLAGRPSHGWPCALLEVLRGGWRGRAHERGREVEGGRGRRCDDDHNEW